MNLYDNVAQTPFQLDLLRSAVKYQQWSLQAVENFLGNNILEIGAGIGNMSRWLPLKESLILSEVDSKMLPELKNTVNKTFGFNQNVEVLHINLSKDWKKDLINKNIDTIVSFNVMEHVEDDYLFFTDLVDILKQNKTNNLKRIITFVPAHKLAYNSIDKNYDHFRRYSISDLKKIKNLVIPQADFFARYFNSFGLIGWFLHGNILKRKEVTSSMVNSFETICPIIKPIDNFLQTKLKCPFGQSVFSVVSFK
ncbi:class I SAM-dependent methyltransferase [Candidatus Dependentiae bacterium]|nr:class I SAM-dependent methyltransferase [Candidatus Dependentiae bacterium]